MTETLQAPAWTPPRDPLETAADVLRALIPRLSYKEGWEFRLDDNDRLMIRLEAPNSLDPGRRVGIVHTCPMTPWPLDERALARWVFEHVAKVERHEACEFFKVDGRAPFFPDHHSENPYAMRESW
jgi:hypothetical protein